MKWALAVSSFFAGLACGFIFSHLHTFSFSNKISTADVLNWAIVLMLASILQSYWQNNYSDKRVGKNLLIDQVREAVSILRDVRDLFTNCYRRGKIGDDDRRAMLGLLKNLSNSIGFLDSALKRHKNRFSKVDLSKAQMFYLDYKRILTGGRFPSGPYTGEAYNEEEDAYRTLRECLHETVFQINET